MRYVAFDVETPNRRNDRISAIGITVVENDENQPSEGFLTDYYYSYVNPETHFDKFNTWLTKIDAHTVKNAPSFPELWKTIEPILSDGILVAHNAQFDMGVLRSCLYAYGIEWKHSVPYCCTVQMGRRLLPDISHKLDSMCEYYGIFLDHHHAGSDSRACAEILVRYMQMARIEEFVKTYWI